jgi:hypothetical protein
VESAITILNILYINKFDKATFQEEVRADYTCKSTDLDLKFNCGLPTGL